ncbi:MlaD family protein [Pararhizobium haloflavum]|uniref:MlaD family protein n=1 Tax=Pararhizobium haloflavum TaxID=2037914 RepID=UPI000C194706|nr:MCE family protein [Pararhizobium haloflavum]
METRANYAIVGLFTLLVLAAAFGFVYWMTNYGSSGDVAPLNIRIPGSANGLSVGSPVRFNGISIGSVRGLNLDREDPSFVVARTDVRADAPVTGSTKAVLEIQGLTGSAYIELSTGDVPGDNILQEALESGVPAVLTADPSSVTNLLATADQILTRANNVVGEIEGFVQDAREPLTETLRNTSEFSQALSDNADGIDQFLESVASLSDTFTGLSGRLDTTFEAAENLMTSIDPAKIDSILGNVDQVTADLSQASGQITEIVGTFRQTAETFQGFTQTASQSIDRVDSIVSNVDTIVASVDAERLSETLDNIAAASADARAAIASTEAITRRFGERGEDIDGFITDVIETADRLNAVAVRVDGVIAKVDTALGEGEVNDILAQVETAVSSFAEVAQAIDATQIGEAVDDIAAASQSAREAVANTEAITRRFGEREEDIDQFITDVTQMADRLNAASVRVDGVLAKVDGFLGEGDASNLLAEAEAAITSFRQVADNINGRVGPIAANLERFSNSGLRDVEALIAETRRSINRIERSISSIERNPQRLLFGGDEVKQFDGRTRR